MLFYVRCVCCCCCHGGVVVVIVIVVVCDLCVCVCVCVCVRARERARFPGRLVRPTTFPAPHRVESPSASLSASFVVSQCADHEQENGMEQIKWQASALLVSLLFAI